jgi:hypothetical protein
MTKQVWQVERGVTDVTSQVKSMNYSTGRRTQFDSWAPGSLVLTIINNNGQANPYDLNDKITLTAVGTSWFQWFYVQEVLFNDLGGEGKGSTATIVCTDLLGRLGRGQVFEQDIAADTTLAQIDTAFDFLMPTGTDFYFAGGAGASIAAADDAYTGTALNRLNLNILTEQGWIAVTDIGIYLYGRDDVYNFTPTLTYARTASGSYQFGYSDIRRIALGSDYLNTCTVTPPVAPAQNAIDTTAVGLYGTYGAEFATVDDTGSQALSFAQWQVLTRSNPDELSFQISISDTANDLTEFFNSLSTIEPVVTVSYQKPGSPTVLTSTQLTQGFSMIMTPSRTDIEIYTSPSNSSYLDFFILDSATDGVLDTSQLGW